jgi:competence CoiA-like predicted nuclease
VNSVIKDISNKNWHNENQQYLANDFKAQGFTVYMEKNIPTPGGHKTRRRADILVEELKLVVEIQKSSATAKELIERCEDYIGAGYRVLWIMNDDKWQPDSDNNPELAGEDEDVYIKWRNYSPSMEGTRYIYNSNRFSIINTFHNNDMVYVMYAIQSGGQSRMMYRKLENTVETTRVLTPKFSNAKHLGGTDNKNHNQPPEEFKGFVVTSSIIAKDTFKLSSIR